MTSSYYPVTTDNFYVNTQSKSMPSTSDYSSYQTTTKNASDDDDDDLDALRKAALQTLYSKKRKSNRDHSSVHRNSRSSSRSYSSSRSSSTRSSISRSYSSSSLSSISSNSLDKNDKDYRFELKEKASTADIDERFPNDNNDLLIVNCPIQDDDLLLQDEQRTSTSKKTSDLDERKAQTTKSKRSKSPPVERPVSITVKLNSDEFDLRQLIKKRRTDETSSNHHRVVQILPKDNPPVVHKTIHDRLSSSRSSEKYHKH